MTPKKLTLCNWGDIMERLRDGLNRVPKDREDVEVYLLKLQYALRDKSTLIDYQEERYSDRKRQLEYTNY